MFQEFGTQNRTHAYLITALFSFWVYVLYMLYFLRLTPLFSVIAMQRFDFKTSLIAIKPVTCYDFKSVFNLRMISK